MNKLIITFFLFTIFVSTICVPVSELSIEDLESQQEHFRVKRFTCDVLSVEAKGVKLNDAACATHCLFRGKRGGWCDNRKVCNCR